MLRGIGDLAKDNARHRREKEGAPGLKDKAAGRA